MAKAITDNRKSRGRPKVGAKLVGVRVDPDLLAQLDVIANEAGVTRPQMLRFAFSEWMESYEGNATTKRASRPIMVHLQEVIVKALDDASGGADRSEIIHQIVVTWLVEGGFLPRDKFRHVILPPT
ncbi:MAG: ribbon-helix-helix domain-containing protein [Hyphomicrobiales bacterium]|nr:ribbon-helix-helix domain-containing protein [Hyphomicrobiales bacterium]